MADIINTTITATSGSNFESSGSKTLTFYNVQSEDIRKSSGLIDLPIPILDSNGKIVMDLMGASREISIEGEVTINDVGTGNLYKYAQDIVGLKTTAGTLIDGAQGLKQYTYAPESLNRGTGGSSRTIKVCVSDSTIKAKSGNPNSLTYSVTMMEVGTLV